MQRDLWKYRNSDFVCVAANGAMRFSVCSILWFYTLFIFGDIPRMKYIMAIIKLIKWMAPALGVLAAVFCLIAVSVFLYKKLNTLDVSGYIEQQKQKNTVRKRNRQAQRGVWLFPSECFYRQCAEHSITTFDSDYSVQKAANIIIALANKEGIKQENLEKYLMPANFYKYYNQGKDIADHKDIANALRSKQPRKATPTYSEAVFFRRVANLSGLTGLDKRRQMLTYLLGDFQHKIEVKKEYETSRGVFETAMILQPPKEYIPDQSEIHVELSKNAFYLMCGIPDLPYDVELLEECARDVADQLENMNSKVVLSIPTSADILSNLHICKTEVQKSDSGVLHITLTIALKKPLTLDVPSSINMAIDGILRGTVMFENSPVGEILFPLPLYGIPANTIKTTKLIGLCAYSVESDYNTRSWSKFMDIDSPLNSNQVSEALKDILEEDAEHSPADLSEPEYTVKLANTQNLWIMEV